nr:hypothetical protein Itr_chr03CG20210 [Ipomoea trifida]
MAESKVENQKQTAQYHRSVRFRNIPRLDKGQHATAILSKSRQFDNSD